MSYPCGMIQDLLPLYHDGVCTQESRAAVEEHLAGCASCRSYYERLKSGAAFAVPNQNSQEELQMADSLKKVKRRLNKRVKMIVGAAAAVVLAALGIFQLLFNLPVKEVDLKDVTVSAEVYSFSELMEGIETGDFSTMQVYVDQQDDEQVSISLGENDDSEMFSVVIPDLAGQSITISTNTMEQCEYVSVISWSSPYFLREITYDDRYSTDNVIYVKAFKTTLLNNKAQEYNSRITGLEMKKIDRIVYVGSDGSQTLLWQNPEP